MASWAPPSPQQEREQSAAWEDVHRYDHDEHDPPEEDDRADNHH